MVVIIRRSNITQLIKRFRKQPKPKGTPTKKLRALRPSPCQGKRGGGDNKEEPHDSRNNALWTQLKPPGTSRCNRTPQDPQKKTAQKITRFWMQPKPLGTSKKNCGRSGLLPAKGNAVVTIIRRSRMTQEIKRFWVQPSGITKVHFRANPKNHCVDNQGTEDSFGGKAGIQNNNRLLF